VLFFNRKNIVIYLCYICCIFTFKGQVAVSVGEIIIITLVTLILVIVIILICVVRKSHKNNEKHQASQKGRKFAYHNNNRDDTVNTAFQNKGISTQNRFTDSRLVKDNKNIVNTHFISDENIPEKQPLLPTAPTKGTCMC